MHVKTSTQRQTNNGRSFGLIADYSYVFVVVGVVVATVKACLLFYPSTVDRRTLIYLSTQ